jgi:hypothetical protein
MKNIFVLLLGLFFVSNLMAQFSLETELQYLQHINPQNRVDLIKNNLPNAEGMVEQILQNPTPFSQKSASIFITELAYSYLLTDKPEAALHRLLLQRCLFPFDSLDAYSHGLFEEVCLRSGLGFDQVQPLWKNSSAVQEFNFDQQLLLSIKLTVSLYLKEMEPYILQSAQVFKSRNNMSPLWLDEWLYFSKIRIREKQKVLLIDLEKNYAGKVDISTIESDKLRKKAYRKSIRYYLKSNSFHGAGELIGSYEIENQNVLESFDLCFKKFRLLVRW